MERKINFKKNMALLTWLSKPIAYFSQNWLSAKRSIDPVSRRIVCVSGLGWAPCVIHQSVWALPGVKMKFYKYFLLVIILLIPQCALMDSFLDTFSNL